MELSTFDQNMAAIAFAEAGEPETAKSFLPGQSKPERYKVPMTPKKKPYLGTVVFGALSLTVYVMLFQNEKLVTDLFTRGGWNFVWPVCTAFFFSFIHGAFASDLLRVLGLEAKK